MTCTCTEFQTIQRCFTAPKFLHACLHAFRLMQFIVELEGGNDSSVDLAGDAGVVGRWLVEGDAKNPELRMDLKGVVYAATTVSLLRCIPHCYQAREKLGLILACFK